MERQHADQDCVGNGACLQKANDYQRNKNSECQNDPDPDARLVPNYDGASNLVSEALAQRVIQRNDKGGEIERNAIEQPKCIAPEASECLNAACIGHLDLQPENAFPE